MKRNAKIAWLLALLCNAGFVAQVVVRLPTATGQDMVDTVFFALLVPSFSVLAAMIITRQPGNRVGWLMMIIALGAVNPVPIILTFLLSPPSAITPAFWLLLWIDNWSWTPFVFPIFLIPLHFPTGRPPSPRWGWVNRLAIGLWSYFAVIVLFVDMLGPLNGGWEPLPNPYGFLPEKLLEPLFGIPWFIGLMTVLLGSVISLIVRYRRARSMERQQIKWLLYVGALFAVVYASLFFDSDDPGVGWQDIAFFLSILAMPVAIGIAILRYRLFDIDLIIRKTALYAILTALLALVYFGSVVLLQAVVGRTAGAQSPLIIVLSTLLIAALFTTLRRRVQTVIDRRFFRSKYDAQRELDRFAQTARDEVALDALTKELMRVVQETMQPDKASIWLKPVDADKR